MTPAGPLQSDPPLIDRLRGVEARFAELGRGELREVLQPLAERLDDGLPDAEVAPAVEGAIALCRRLYASARSAEALPLARAALAQASHAGDHALSLRAATACGVLAADTADLVQAIQHHVHAMRLAAVREDRIGMGGIWNNIGLVMMIAGNYDMAMRCYQRSIVLVETLPAPVYSRYAALANLADSAYQLGQVAEGLQHAREACKEETRAFREQNLQNALLLKRNLVRLLVASGGVAEAAPHVAEAAELAQRAGVPRAQIAAATTRAVYELAVGRMDIALTRLDNALTRARQVPAALRDTLACVIRAEEAAGHVERALLRLNELSEHIYRSAIESARTHIELAGLSLGFPNPQELRERQARARLASQLSPPAQPDGWSALQRLGVSAAMRIDPSGWHGMRVGALSKALAAASGLPPLEALEVGLAAEVHDIGLLSVPEGILAKRGALNDAERAIVERHVDAGAEMLRDDRHPRMLRAREIARYHHARWDGEGYPERVGGKLIPLGARICAVADAYDSMVCGLAGRAPATMDEALAELARGAGSQFDPELVACFDRLIRAETEDLGMDLASSAGMEGFQELVNSLQEDRGFV